MIRSIAAILLLAALDAGACEGLAVDQGWIREPAPGMAMTAGYARLNNTSSQPLTIDRVSSVGFESTELHRTFLEGGMSRMRPGLPLTLTPGASQRLEPGGYHLMLFDPTVDLRTGESVPVEFHCRQKSTTSTLTVRTDPP